MRHIVGTLTWMPVAAATRVQSSALAGQAIAAEHLLNERVTDTEHVGQDAL